MADPGTGDDAGRSDPSAAWVLELLRSLPGGVSLPHDMTSDQLVEALCDHARELDGMTLLRAMTDAMLPALDRVATEACTQGYWFIDSGRLAEDMVGSMYADLQNGQRTRPFAAWAWRTAAHLVQVNLDDPDVLMFRADETAAVGERMLCELARRCNHLPYQHRQVVWFTFVMEMPEDEIALMTAMPTERVEWIITSAMDGAIRAVLQVDGIELPESIGTDTFWRMMRGETEDDDSDEGEGGSDAP